MMQTRQIPAAELRPYMPNHGDKVIVTIKNVNGLVQGTVSFANAGDSAQEPYNVSDNVRQFLQTPGSWLEVTWQNINGQIFQTWRDSYGGNQQEFLM